MRPLGEPPEHRLGLSLRQQHGHTSIDGGPSAAGEQRLEALELIGQHRSQRGVDVNGGEDEVRDVVGEGRLHLGFVEGVDGEVGDTLAARHGHPRPDRHRADHEEEDGEHTEH